MILYPLLRYPTRLPEQTRRSNRNVRRNSSSLLRTELCRRTHTNDESTICSFLYDAQSPFLILRRYFPDADVSWISRSSSPLRWRK